MRLSIIISSHFRAEYIDVRTQAFALFGSLPLLAA